jgi:hypothetical protein
MSQQIRRVLVAFGLMAALSLTLPSPSHAAGLRSPGLAGDFTACLWAWLEGLLPGAATPAPSHRPALKAGTVIVSTAPGDPTAATKADQGSAIDPDGLR